MNRAAGDVGGGRGSKEAAGRRENDLGVSSFLTSIRAVGLDSLVAWGAGLINNEFTPHNAPPPSCLQGHPTLQPAASLSKLSNPSFLTETLETVWAGG